MTFAAHAETKAPEPAALSERATMLAPIQVESLTLTPIVAAKAVDPKTDPEVIVLDEAFAQKVVAIREKDSESVNELTLQNRSDRPLFVLAGEVIIGGKQDRIIGTNTVIPAKTTQTVPVFCVEHGRWDDSGKEFTTAKALAHGRLRGKANFAAQGEVWAEVSTSNKSHVTENGTDTYRKIAEKQTTAGGLGKSEKLVEEALAKVPAAQRAQMIGYVVALNGKVATVDMFTSPALFKKLEAKLVKSYLTEAVGVTPVKGIVAPTSKDVKDFIADAEKAKTEKSFENGASITNRYSGARTGKSSVTLKAKVNFSDNAAHPAPPAAAPVYESYQAK
ncbi:MAG: hypothetical protein KIT31_04370 [Deltaproteobacteria bacterium]|nr:hypothetical protein [Deltaproteobacteria bacterium]